VLDECLRQDPCSRVACDCYATQGLVIVGGEISTKATLNVQSLVRELGVEIGYGSAGCGYDISAVSVANALHAQSPDIAQGVLRSQGRIGAGDQGLMFGYACRQTPELMPLPIMLAHGLARRLALLRKQRKLPFLLPDGKTQVTVEYRDGKPVRVEHAVLAAQHTAAALSAQGKTMSEDARQALIDQVLLPVLDGFIDRKTKFTVNGTGRFLRGGPLADTGLTGRKVMVDTYGGWAMHGGGALSGKDATKVDRSASCMARYIAKNVVAAQLAEECLLQLSYCIGRVEPVSVMVNTCGTGRLADPVLLRLVKKVFPLSPAGMIAHLKLCRPMYRGLAAYGQFGRGEAECPWEALDAVEELCHQLAAVS
jgi:S-adenosylmethionine synthetase